MCASPIYAELPLDPGRNEIRLLDIFPPKQQSVNSGEHVSCRLHRVDLDSKPQFNALSYTWGDKAVRTDIYVNGVITSVTANLESALRHLRRADQVVTIWADALCIHQEDTVEKAHQVRRMHNVYSKARRTVVWLGPEGDGSDMAMRAMQSTGRQAMQNGILIHAASVLNAGFAGQDPAFHGLRVLVEAVGWAYPFKAVRKLGERPYWSRLWVQQEYALGQEIMIQCGNIEIDGHQYNAAYLFSQLLQRSLCDTIVEEADCVEPMLDGADYEVDTNEKGSPWHTHSRAWHVLQNAIFSRSGKLIEIRRLYENWQQRPEMTPPRRLCALLESINSEGTHESETSALGVSIPRDRIFGFVGMLGQNAVLGFPVDYNVLEEETFVATTRWLLLCGQFSLLSFARTTLHARMPSWSPAWGTQLRAPAMGKGFFRPSGTLPSHAVQVGANIIRFSGILLGRLERWREGVWRIPIADQYEDGNGIRTRATSAAKEGWQL
ncbi:hypothetical protein LTR17_027417 [Elasticomyces elasticus]|nr:hypothetical protein LTR17_027417 [Elasticomyces elasticus]